MSLFVDYFKKAGVLRIMLALLAITVTVTAPFAGEHAVKEGWAIVPTIIVPATVPIIFFVIWLDVLMASVFRADAVGDEVKRQRFATIVKLDVVLVSVMTLSWLPYFYSIVAI
ncbi:MAG: hypothetical protein IME93_05310 [Proteobacteria bacterium]|nr:hypothetical protein [Pseudomonadota bacterium]